MKNNFWKSGFWKRDFLRKLNFLIITIAIVALLELIAVLCGGTHHTILLMGASALLVTKIIQDKKERENEQRNN